MNKSTIAAVAALFLAILVVGIVWFLKLSKTEKISRVKMWLRYAVTKAEKYMGSSTGQIKLLWVYNQFVQRFPLLGRIIPFKKFSGWVDSALDWLAEQVDQNDAIKKYINDSLELYNSNTGCSIKLVC